MKQAIIVVSHIDYKEQTHNLLNTINTHYDLIVVTNTGSDSQYEMKAIYKGLELGYDEFFVLQDTVEIKDNSLFDLIFKEYKGKSVFMNKRGQMFLNKYQRTILMPMVSHFPVVKCKADAVKAEEIIHNRYKTMTTPIILDEGFIDNDSRVEKFGQTRMLIENKWIRKYKGCWNEGMIGEAR